MVTGHFGLAAGVKAWDRFVPLWALMAATVWLDILFIPTYALGIEDTKDVPGTDGGYGDVIIHADWTHSLVGATVISIVTEAALMVVGALLYWRAATAAERAAGAIPRRANLVAAVLIASGAVVLALDVLVG